MRRVSNSNISGTRFSAGARAENHPHFRHGPVPKTCCRKFQTENVLFPAAQETQKFSKPKKGKKKFGIPAAQETALSILFFFFFSCLFFYESRALHRQLCSGICYFLVTLLVLHMLFFGVFASNYYTLLGGGQTSAYAFNRQLRYFMVVSGVHSSVCCVQRMCVQQYECVYAKYTLCVHTAVRPRNIHT